MKIGMRTPNFKKINQSKRVIIITDSIVTNIVRVQE